MAKEKEKKVEEEKLKKADYQRIAKDAFENNPKDGDVVHVTSDGQAFFHEIHAKNHANSNKLKINSLSKDDLTTEE